MLRPSLAHHILNTVDHETYSTRNESITVDLNNIYYTTVVNTATANELVFVCGRLQ